MTPESEQALEEFDESANKLGIQIAISGQPTNNQYTLKEGPDCHIFEALLPKKQSKRSPTNNDYSHRPWHKTKSAL